MTIYTIQFHSKGQWFTGFCGRMQCSLNELLSALAVAMPNRKLRVWGDNERGVTKVSVY